MDKSLSIGVFDSGMGGLTVLRALRSRLPYENFIYLGDTARLPYGTKSPDTVRQYAAQMAKVLVEKKIKALVIACNTATTVALEHLQHLLPDIIVVGVLEPGARAAVEASKNNRIFVMATETTIASGGYQARIRQYCNSAEVSTAVCGLLVALAEEGMTDNAISKATLLHYLSDMGNEDTILLGCTHFPVFRDALRLLLPETVAIVDSCEATANTLFDALQSKQLICSGLEKGRIKYLVTDSVQRFCRIGGHFLGDGLLPESVELI